MEVNTQIKLFLEQASVALNKITPDMLNKAYLNRSEREEMEKALIKADEIILRDCRRLILSQESKSKSIDNLAVELLIFLKGEYPTKDNKEDVEAFFNDLSDIQKLSKQEEDLVKQTAEQYYHHP